MRTIKAIMMPQKKKILLCWNSLTTWWFKEWFVKEGTQSIHRVMAALYKMISCQGGLNWIYGHSKECSHVKEV